MNDSSAGSGWSEIFLWLRHERFSRRRCRRGHPRNGLYRKRSVTRVAYGVALSYARKPLRHGRTEKETAHVQLSKKDARTIDSIHRRSSNKAEPAPAKCSKQLNQPDLQAVFLLVRTRKRSDVQCSERKLWHLRHHFNRAFSLENARRG